MAAVEHLSILHFSCHLVRPIQSKSQEEQGIKEKLSEGTRSLRGDNFNKRFEDFDERILDILKEMGE